MSKEDRIKAAFGIIEKSPPAKWVQEMHDHYNRTGQFRPKDIRRLVGDQTEGVKLGTASMSAAFKSF